MPLELVRGPANAGKAGCVLQAYRAVAPRGALLVVPNAQDVAHYERELVAREALLGGRVLAFGALVGEIAARTRSAVPVLSDVQRRRVVAAAVGRGRFTVLADSAATPGFATAVERLLDELTRRLVTPQRFAQALGAWVGEEPGRAALAADLSGVVLRYARLLARLGTVDRDLLAWRALSALREQPGRWGGTPVLFYGFDDLSALERDAVETLARACDVTLGLTAEPGRVALAGRAATVNELEPLATRVVALESDDAHYAPASRAALHHLERRLFEDDEAPAVPAGGAVRLLESGGERAEAELVAAQVLALLADGVPAEEIAVVVRSPDAAAGLVEQVLGTYGIAASARRRVDVAHTPLGRGLLALARCALTEDAVAGDLLAYLRTPGFLHRPGLVDRLEAEVRGTRTATVAGARALWADLVPAMPLGELDELAAAAAAGTGQTLAALDRRAAALFAAPRRRAAATLAPEERVDAAVLAALRSALADLGALAARDLALVPAGAELVELLGALPVELGDPPAAGLVQVTGPLAIRGRRVQALFLCGLQEGAFPLTARPDPLLDDERRRELAAASGLALPPVEDTLADERALFYNAVSRPTDLLVLSYRISDEEGNPALPSFFVEDVRDLFAGRLADAVVRRPLAEVTWPAGHAPTPAEGARAAAAARAPVPPAPIAELRSAPVLAELRRRPFSPGALEAYGRCPVGWFVERVLRPRGLEPDEDHLRRGHVLHAMLERAIGGLEAPLGPATIPAARERGREILEAERSSAPLAASPGADEAEARWIAAAFDGWLEHEAAGAGGWQPRALEVGFGVEGSELGPLDLDGVALRGKIDRVDVDPGGRRAVVRDYKTRRVHALARWEPDRRLQVQLYVLAVERLLGLEPVAAVYQGIAERRRPRGMVLAGAGEEALGAGVACREDVVGPEELRAELARAANLAVELARQVREGDVHPEPGTCHSLGCRYPGICRGGAA